MYRILRGTRLIYSAETHYALIPRTGILNRALGEISKEASVLGSRQRLPHTIGVIISDKHGL